MDHGPGERGLPEPALSKHDPNERGPSERGLPESRPSEHDPS